MKKCLCVVLAVLFSFGSVVAQDRQQKEKKPGFWKKLGRVILSAVPPTTVLPNMVGVIPQITLGGPDRLAIEGNSFVVTDGSKSYYCSLIAHGEEIGQLGPGDIAYDTRYFEFQNYVAIPVLALIYEDAAMTRYIGVARNIFYNYNYGYGARSESWIFDEGSIEWVDGRRPATPPVVTNLENTKVELPRKWWSGTSGLQIVLNVSGVTADISVNGVPHGRIRTGGVFYLEEKQLTGFYGNVTVQLRLVDAAGHLAGKAHYYLGTLPQGVWAQQWIVSNYYSSGGY